jgi:hypothetical protein
MVFILDICLLLEYGNCMVEHLKSLSSLDWDLVAGSTYTLAYGLEAFEVARVFRAVMVIQFGIRRYKSSSSLVAYPHFYAFGLCFC